MEFESNLAFAQKMDQEDPLAEFRSKFHIPQHEGKDTIYFCGNSLGLQPKSAKEHILRDLKNWEELGVEGHFTGDWQWVDYHKRFRKPLSNLVGSLESEVVAMNNLTVNLHLAMVSFYRPTKEKFKIICEGHAFPSDQYAFESQVKFHGFNPDEAIVELVPTEGEDTLKTEDIIATIEEHKNETALILIGGLQYYTGQFFDLETIADYAQQNDITFGVDLAHGVGNMPLKLHDWGIDFAVWCSYKYLNSGPGAVSGMFVHEKHHHNVDLPRFAGWWGHEEKERFMMKKGFIPIPSADGWQLSNCPVFNMSAHYASLEIFEEAGMDRLREKSLKLSGYLLHLLEELEFIKVITPKTDQDRGCQVSMYVEENGKKIFDYLQSKGVIADWREPNVIRIAPVPLYNTFEEVFQFFNILKEAKNIIND
jgi:kynureninase